MKYPRLPQELDKRKKLLDKDIKDIQKAYKQALPFPTRKELDSARKLGIDIQSEHQWINEIAEMYNVGYSTVYYWTHSEHRAEKRMIIAKRRHKTQYQRKLNRLEAAKRYPLQDIFKELLSAKHDKRKNRHTFKGLSLKYWEKYFNELPDPSLPN